MNGFDKVIGYSDVKEELAQVADILKNKERYSRLGVKTPTGVLLYGVPGVGKTLMAKSLAEESGWNTFYCRKDEPNGDFVKKIKDTFLKAKENTPAVVILDDMDKFTEKSRFNQSSDEFVTVQSCIDEVKGREVLIIATANSLRSFPSSLLRPGRIDRIIEVKVPRGEDAEKIVAHYIEGKAFEKGIDTQVIARIMDGRSCAALEEVINEAGIFAGFHKSEVITMEHFLEACLRTVFYSPLDFERRMVPEDDYAYQKNAMLYRSEGGLLPQVICHEAGHAVISELLVPGSVTLVSSYSKNGEAGGFTSCYRDENYNYYRWMESSIISSLGGKAAVEQCFGSAVSGAVSDLEFAFCMVQELVTKECTCGFPLHGVGMQVSEELLSRQEQAVASEVERYYRKAKRLLAENNGFFQAVVEELGKKKLLTAADLRRIKEECAHSSFME